MYTVVYRNAAIVVITYYVTIIRLQIKKQAFRTKIVAYFNTTKNEIQITIKRKKIVNPNLPQMCQ